MCKRYMRCTQPPPDYSSNYVIYATFEIMATNYQTDELTGVRQIDANFAFASNKQGETTGQKTQYLISKKVYY